MLFCHTDESKDNKQIILKDNSELCVCTYGYTFYAWSASWVIVNLLLLC